MVSLICTAAAIRPLSNAGQRLLVLFFQLRILFRGIVSCRLFRRFLLLLAQLLLAHIVGKDTVGVLLAAKLALTLLFRLFCAAKGRRRTPRSASSPARAFT